MVNSALQRPRSIVVMAGVAAVALAALRAHVAAQGAAEGGPELPPLGAEVEADAARSAA